MNVYLPV